jgi:[acyl-carrier-protein] S-malonyltransferase
MAPAVESLRAAAGDLTAAEPAVTLLSNRDGAAAASGADWLDRIVTQVSAPVRWNMVMESMAGLGATAFIELPPAGTLTGLARRALPDVARVSLKTPDDLQAARSLIAEHGTLDPHQDGHVPEWRLLVAPHAGTFRSGSTDPAAAAPGTTINSGAEIGHVEQRGGRHVITPQFPATILEWLVEDGDPVSVGQPLVRLQPAE